jgi:DNA-binding transcriptional regulator LsrR (DeoR family)
MDEQLLKRREVAERIHASEATVRRLGRARQLDEVRISPGVVRVKASSVDRLIERGYTAPEPQEAA